MMISERTYGAGRRSGRLYKIVVVALLLIAGVTLSAHAWAIREVQVFDVSVTIPTSDFYVLPIKPGFLEREQEMAWNLVARTLSPLREHFDVKNSAGGIAARLGQEPSLSNGQRSIVLNVTFNGQVLSLDETLVVPATEARAGKRVLLEIAAAQPEGGYVAGDYFGSVQLMFDAVRP